LRVSILTETDQSVASVLPPQGRHGAMAAFSYVMCLEFE
jgi:hypothetical protein